MICHVSGTHRKISDDKESLRVKYLVSEFLA